MEGKDNMNSKERVRIALSFEEPDRVPISAEYVPEIKKKLDQRVGDEEINVGVIPCTIFEVSWGLRGLDKFMMDMVSNKDFAHALMDKVVEFPLAAGRKLIELGVDMLWTGDDVAMQTGMMISLSLWREYLKPRYAKLYREFKKLNPTIKIAYHSCGNCEAILDEMYEIGVDVMNPIQTGEARLIEVGSCVIGSHLLLYITGINGIILLEKLSLILDPFMTSLGKKAGIVNFFTFLPHPQAPPPPTCLLRPINRY